jgi:hypothetical protein
MPAPPGTSYALQPISAIGPAPTLMRQRQR